MCFLNVRALRFLYYLVFLVCETILSDLMLTLLVRGAQCARTFSDGYFYFSTKKGVWRLKFHDFSR